MSNLSQYLGTLLTDDDALRAFLADPVGQASKHGLTKAERAVLRRVLTSASTGSVNGYSVVRPLSGYRMAAGLLQHVIHHSAAHHANKMAGSDLNTLTIFYGPEPDDPGYKYNANQISFMVPGSTIGEMMENAQDSSGGAFAYENASGSFPDPGPFIGTIIINGAAYNAPPSDDGSPFWVYRVNGQPGDPGQSYENFPVPEGGVVTWQVIAPSGPKCPPIQHENVQLT